MAAAGQAAASASALADAYFDVFHRIEPALKAEDYPRTRQIEQAFLLLRGQLDSGADASQAKASLASLMAQIQQASAALNAAPVSGLAASLQGFSNAFVILTREGTEALLIVTALLMYLNRVGHAGGRRAVYLGIVAAVLATGLTWFGLQHAIAHSGVAQETIEGVASLVAAGVLFYVSYWLISKAEARRWQAFLTGQLDRGISRGSLAAFATAAFLAVYREGAETILMFQPIMLGAGGSQLTGVLAGIAAAMVSLVAVFWALRFASVRMAIRPFFRITGVLLFGLAVVFAGKGVTELQEAGILVVSPLPGKLGATILALPGWLREILGLGASLQSLAIQGLLLAGAIVSLLAIRLTSSPPDADAPHRPQSPKAPHVVRTAMGEPVAK